MNLPWNWYTVCVSEQNPSTGRRRAPILFSVLLYWCLILTPRTLVSLPFQPLYSHFTTPLLLESVAFKSSCILPHWHILHNCPEVQRVGIIPDHFLARFRFKILSCHFGVAYSCFVFFMVSVKYDTRTTDVIVFHCIAQVFVFSLNSEKYVSETFENKYFMVKPGTLTPSLKMSIFRSFQNSLIFSIASRKGTTSRLLYHTKKSRKLSKLLSFHTRWQYLYCSSVMSEPDSVEWKTSGGGKLGKSNFSRESTHSYGK